MSNLVKDDNLDDDGNWVVNFRISIEDVRMLYTYADFYSKHAKNIDTILSKEDIKNNEVEQVDQGCRTNVLCILLLQNDLLNLTPTMLEHPTESCDKHNRDDNHNIHGKLSRQEYSDVCHIVR